MEASGNRNRCILSWGGLSLASGFLPQRAAGLGSQ